jgi:hypothetical protein
MNTFLKFLVFCLPVSSAGDVNGDGLDDLIVGAKNVKVGKEYSAGKSYVVFGKQDNTKSS